MSSKTPPAMTALTDAAAEAAIGAAAKTLCLPTIRDQRYPWPKQPPNNA